MAAWRRMPVVLRLAVVGTLVIASTQVVFAVLYRLHLLGDWLAGDDNAFSTALTGSWFAFGVLFILGLAQLARRSSGTTRIGARIALVAAVLQLAIYGARLAVALCDVMSYSPEPSWYLRQVIAPCVTLLLAIGLGVATRRWYWLLAGICAALVSSPPWFLSGSIHELFATAPLQGILLFDTLRLAFALVVVVMAIVACRDVTASAGTQQPGRGLRRISLALHGQAVAVGTIVTLTLVLDATKSSDLQQLCRIAILGAMGVEVVSLVVLGLGAVATAHGRGPLPSWLLLTSGVIALCLAGRTLFAGFARAHHFFRRRGFGVLTFGTQDDKYVTAISAQVLLACAIVGVLISLAVAARKEGLEALRARMMLRIGTFSALVVAAMTGQLWISEVYELSAADMTILIASNGALFASWLVAARVARHGLDGGTSLPTAKLLT